MITIKRKIKKFVRDLENEIADEVMEKYATSEDQLDRSQKNSLFQTDIRDGNSITSACSVAHKEGFPGIGTSRTKPA